MEKSNSSTLVKTKFPLHQRPPCSVYVISKDASPVFSMFLLQSADPWPSVIVIRLQNRRRMTLHELLHWYCIVRRLGPQDACDYMTF